MGSLRPAQKHEGGQQGWAGSAGSTFLAIDSLKSPVQMHGQCASRSERQTQQSLGQQMPQQDMSGVPAGLTVLSPGSKILASGSQQHTLQ